MPRRLLFVDTETHDGSGEMGSGEQFLRLGAACFWQRPGSKQPERLERWPFNDARIFWSRLDRYAVPGKRLVIFAHGAQFDLQVLGGLEAMRAAGWVLMRRPILDKGRVIVHAQKAGATILILDSYNFLRGTLEELGEDLGFPKAPKPPRGAAASAWLTYCERDVEVTRRAIGAYLELIETLQLGHFGATLPAQAMHGFRHRFMTHKIAVHSDPVGIELERAAYFGGRCEAWQLGLLAGHFVDLDMNAAYLAAMATGEFPLALRYTCEPRDLRGLLKRLDGALAVAEVRIVTSEPRYPKRLPSGRLAFPVGDFRTTLATPELRVAIEKGAIAEVGRMAVYASAPLFVDFAEELWRVRSELMEMGAKFHARILKDLGVTLYGKFGERKVTWSHQGDEPELPDEILEVLDADTGRKSTYRRLGGRLELREQDEETDNSFPAIAAHVSSANRVRLYELAETAGIAETLYLDTDGLTTTRAGAERLIGLVDPKALGGLKIVRETDDLEIRGPKDLRFGDLRMTKGRKRNARDLGDGRFEQEEFLGIEAALRAGHHGGPLIRTVAKRNPSPTILGSVTPSGRVLPIRLA